MADEREPRRGLRWVDATEPSCHECALGEHLVGDPTMPMGAFHRCTVGPPALLRSRRTCDDLVPREVEEEVTP
ncbi:MAG: hypothetical protein AAFZ87_10700 [Planctomycetota bacterium]